MFGARRLTRPPAHTTWTFLQYWMRQATSSAESVVQSGVGGALARSNPLAMSSLPLPVWEYACGLRRIHVTSTFVGHPGYSVPQSPLVCSPPLFAVPSLDFIAPYTTRTTPGKAADISTAAESIQRPSLRQNQSLP